VTYFWSADGIWAVTDKNGAPVQIYLYMVPGGTAQ
jgi:hypothetical protein